MNTDQPVADATTKTQTDALATGTQEPTTKPADDTAKQTTPDADAKKDAEPATPAQPADQTPAVQPDVSKDQGNADTKVDTDQSTQTKPTAPVHGTTAHSDTTQGSNNSKQPSGTDNHDKNDSEKTSAQNTAEKSPKKLSDVVPSTTVWISGMVGNKQYDCAGPFEAPFKIDKPTWPYVNVVPNPNYTNQVFDYDKGEWVPTDAKSQGQMLTDLIKQVANLQDDSQKHDQSADQSQKMGMQLTKVMLQLSSKVDALNTKIDGIVNDKKDGDKAMEDLLFTMVKEQYDWGWIGADKSYVASYVKQGGITPDQYKEITGEAYVA